MELIEIFKWDEEKGNIETIARECKNFDETLKNYDRLSSGILKIMHKNINYGLASYDMIMMFGPEEYRENFRSGEQTKIIDYLLSRFFLTAALIAEKNNGEIPKEFRVSGWRERLKDKKEYARLCDIMDITDGKQREYLYNKCIVIPKNNKV